jgi:hypothetical protein
MIGVVLSIAPLAVQASEPVQPPGPTWKEARRDNELTVFFRDNDKLAAREILAVAEIDAPPKAIFDVVTDFENYPKFMPYVKEVRILARKSADAFFEYTLLATPIIAQRDSVNEIRLTRGTPENGGIFRSEWVARPDMEPLRNGVVRVRLNTGAWVIAPLGDGRRSRVTYSILTNPGGNIPRFMTDQSNTVFMPDLFKVVRTRAGARR